MLYNLLNEIYDSALHFMPSASLKIEDLCASPLFKFITFAANECRKSGSLTNILVTVVHAKSEATKEDNPNWHEVMNGPFAEEYSKAAEKEIDTQEEVGAWVVVE